jgi:hypothetical protein
MQRRGKHAFTKIVLFFLRGSCRVILKTIWTSQFSCELTESQLIVEICKRGCSVDSSVVVYSPDSNDVSIEAEESPLLKAVT